MKMLTIALVLGLSTSSAFAANSKTLWQCEGGDFEGLAVTESHGQLSGSAAWDCFPGGGICNQTATVTSSQDGGNTVVEGNGFKLVVETSKQTNSSGEYPAHISATDLTDDADQGRGMTVSDTVDCKLSAE
jgi:hypothetical protein